jgi:hypothetical protein
MFRRRRPGVSLPACRVVDPQRHALFPQRNLLLMSRRAGADLADINQATMVRVPAVPLARYGQPITCYGSVIGEALRRRKHPCARSRSLRSHSSPCPYQLLECVRRAHGAPSTVVGEVAELTVVSIRSNNVRPRVQAMADFAGVIYSQHTALLA